MFGTVNEFETLYEIADDIESRLISLMEISFEDEIISECEMSLEILQDYVREVDSVDEQESLNDFNNFSDLIQYAYDRKEVAWYDRQTEISIESNV